MELLRRRTEWTMMGIKGPRKNGPYTPTPATLLAYAQDLAAENPLMRSLDQSHRQRRSNRSEI